MSNNALIAMSGGVDSSVAAYLTLQNKYNCSGAMMKLYDNDSVSEKGCCSLDDSRDARSVCARLGMPFYVFNFTDAFESEVITRFTDNYLKGNTPNPCIDCNRYMKFHRFYNRARETNHDYIVTGHYAQIEYDNNSNRYLLKKGLDQTKDQSYVLYTMTQDQLAHTMLPLGAMHKSQVREIARSQGFINAKKRESQDICFVPDGDYAEFIRRHTGIKPEKGRFIDTGGKDMGEHNGIIHYTIGQRKGLGISADRPLYVCGIDASRNTVTLGYAEDVYANSLTAKALNLIAVDRISSAMNLRAKVRYSQSEQDVKVRQTDDDTLYMEFASPQRAITRGQAVVLYDGNVVIGGGTIV